MYKSEKREKEFEAGYIEIFEILFLLVGMFFLNVIVEIILKKIPPFEELIEFIEISFKSLRLCIGSLFIYLIICFIIEKIQSESPKRKSKEWKIEVLEIKSKYRNDKISFKKARKMIKKIKKKKEISEKESFLKEENLKILEEECSILNGNQEKSVWV